MDSYGNSGFKGIGRRIETSSLRSNNVRTQILNVSGSSQLDDVTIADGLTVTGGVTVTTGGVTVTNGGITVSNNGGMNITGTVLLNNNLTVNGNTRLGNASGDSVGFYTTAGTAQQTTGVASATVVNGASGDAITVTTFDGYTVAQVVRALRNVGLLA
jgi:hypothetical protein